MILSSHRLVMRVTRKRPDDLAVALLAALQGGLILAQVQGDTRSLETALDTVLDLARLSNREVPADGDTSTP